MYVINKLARRKFRVREQKIAYGSKNTEQTTAYDTYSFNLKWWLSNLRMFPKELIENLARAEKFPTRKMINKYCISLEEEDKEKMSLPWYY